MNLMIVYKFIFIIVEFGTSVNVEEKGFCGITNCYSLGFYWKKFYFLL